MAPTRSTRIRTFFALATLAALLFGAFLWPLPAHVASGVAYTAHAAPDTPPRALVQGDHLQLQYHFDLVHEMLRGRIRAFTNPASVLAVDLTGGTSLVYSVDQNAKPAVGDVRKALAGFDNAAVIQYQEGVGDATLLVKTGETAETEKGRTVAKGDVGSYVTGALKAAFPNAGLKQVSVDEVGSMVGADLKRSGTWAVVLSLCAILIYVAFRFEFGFGLGALVALAHDALISLGIYSLCGRQVSLLVVTALLTIIGYSVNDTIVVFDRIREDLRRDQKTDFRELCNRALNESLSRTVITSVTTFFAVVALFAFGDGSIFDFALTMLIGVIAGTYSSVFIATPIMMWFYKGRRPQFAKETTAV